MSDYKPLACLPVLPLRGIVVFPGCVTHFDVGRSHSARAVEEAMRADQMIFLVAQRDVQCDEPKRNDLYPVGTVAYVRQVLRLPGDNMRILVEGKYRAQLTDMIHTEPYLFARAMELDEPGYHAAVPRTQALVRQAHQLFEQFIDLAVKSGQENLLQGSATDDAGELADFIAQNATRGISARDVATHLGVSRRLADLRFQQFSGETINETIIRCRLDAVKKLLATTNRPIKLVSTACGYADLAYLKTLFKRRFGLTMRAYRAQHSSRAT